MPENQLQKVPAPSVGAYLRNDAVKKRFDEMLGKRSNQFITALIASTNNVLHLSECTPVSVLNAALTVAALDLPINNNLGFAYIIPYKAKKKVGNVWSEQYEAQFQMGWKGFIQLAQRSGQYKTIAATPVYDGQLVKTDPLLGNTFDWSAKKSDSIIGYVAQFQLMNGFGKDLYMTMEEVKDHANRFSQAYRSDQQYDKKNSPWSNDFDAMAQKTVLKQLISKFGPMSIDPQMQMAVERDQAIIEEGGEVDYVDNVSELEAQIRSAESPEDIEGIMLMTTIEQRKKLTGAVTERVQELQSELKELEVDAKEQTTAKSSVKSKVVSDEPIGKTYDAPDTSEIPFE
jgi:recombination protein RecT